MGKERLKAKLFRKWIRENVDTSLVLEPVAERMPNDKLMAVIKDFEAAGYALDESGVPVGLDDDDEKYRDVIIALHRSFEKVHGHPLLDLYLLIERLDMFRAWLMVADRPDKEEISLDELKWWQMIPWKKIRYDVMNRIARLLEIFGYPINENGVPTPRNGKDPNRLWRALEIAILMALSDLAVEVEHE
jgi:hypothetical protein